MLSIKILNETSPLEAVVLGIADSMGNIPSILQVCDPKSKKSVLQGNYPQEKELVEELKEMTSILEKYDVEVLRPEKIENFNQIFARDISMVIEDFFMVPKIASLRMREQQGITYLLDQLSEKKKIYTPPEVRIEGGDVILHNNALWVGYSNQRDFDTFLTARTNLVAVHYLKKKFNHLNVFAFELNKSDDDPKKNALHLDCIFQPVGDKYAVIYPKGFKNPKDVSFVIDKFGKENIFEITTPEMEDMHANFFSITQKIVVSDKNFTRLNQQFIRWGLTVEGIKYSEISKLGGLFRCTTLPLRRKYES